MADQKPRVLIIGAGSMGTVVAYILDRAGADVTFLVRPHRAKQLDRPQLLYCYDDRQLKELKNFAYITDPVKMVGAHYDFILVTLDGAALRSDTGRALVETIGKAARGTDTKVVLGSVFIDLLSWFLATSGLPADQVTNGPLLIHAYPPGTAPELVQTAPAQDQERIAQADQAYTDRLGVGMQLDDSAPAVAKAFADLYNASGISHCAVLPVEQLGTFIDAFFPALMAFGLMGWPKLRDLDPADEVWTLATEATREIQALGRHGAFGQQAAQALTPTTLAESLRDFETKMGAFDLQAFNRFHHGAKVNAQDRLHLWECVRIGEAEGKKMTAVRELLARYEAQ